MLVSKLAVGPLQTNCYIFGCPESRQAAVIDPGDEGSVIRRELEKSGYRVVKVILTHGHADHITGLRGVLADCRAEVLIHAEDAEMLRDPGQNLSAMMGQGFEFNHPVVHLADGQEIAVGTLTLRVAHTPGHTRGSICLVGDGLIFSGDTLFCGGVGRTDFPGGSMQALIRSIREKLLVLPDETTVHPGHGPETSIGAERADNPYLDSDW